MLNKNRKNILDPKKTKGFKDFVPNLKLKYEYLKSNFREQIELNMTNDVTYVQALIISNKQVDKNI